MPVEILIVAVVLFVYEVGQGFAPSRKRGPTARWVLCRSAQRKRGPYQSLAGYPKDDFGSHASFASEPPDCRPEPVRDSGERDPLRHAAFDEGFLLELGRVPCHHQHDPHRGARQMLDVALQCGESLQCTPIAYHQELPRLAIPGT